MFSQKISVADTCKRTHYCWMHSMVSFFLFLFYTLPSSCSCSFFIIIIIIIISFLLIDEACSLNVYQYSILNELCGLWYVKRMKIEWSDMMWDEWGMNRQGETRERRKIYHEKKWLAPYGMRFSRIYEVYY